MAVLGARKFKPNENELTQSNLCIHTFILNLFLFTGLLLSILYYLFLTLRRTQRFSSQEKKTVIMFHMYFNLFIFFSLIVRLDVFLLLQTFAHSQRLAKSYRVDLKY